MKEATRAKLIFKTKAVLRRHIGPDECIKMVQVYYEVTGILVTPGKQYDETRMIRSAIEQLRTDGHPICIKDGKNGGYFWARNSADLEPTIRRFHSRALASLKQEASLKKIPFGDLLKQYEIDFDQHRLTA